MTVRRTVLFANAVDLLDGAQWRCVATAPGSITDPGDLCSATELEWLDAPVPGTTAGAVAAEYGVEAAVERDHDADDWWFVTTLPDGTVGPCTLQVDGLATLAAVWLDGERIAESESMFTPLAVDVAEAKPGVILALQFRSLKTHLAKRRPRGRWRSTLVSQQGLRWVRTSMYGRAPVYSGAPAAVGPWRPVSLTPSGPALEVERVVATVDGTAGALQVRGSVHELAAETLTVEIGDRSVVHAVDDSGSFDVTVGIDDVDLWWPHTHGAQTQYPLRISVGGTSFDCGDIGFRTVETQWSDGRPALVVNGIPVFVRGACWVPVDPIGHNPAAARQRRALEQVRDAGFNMVRLTGTAVYEDSTFWSLCAELGIMVWQDTMLATLDPPEDEEFQALLRTELTAQLRPLQGNPALAVLCGGSETEQQPTMLGLPLESRGMPTLTEHIPAVGSSEAAGVPYFTSTPSAPPGSGALPTHVSSGIAHYFGVGAYLRPLSDLRSAAVGFAGECLAFAIPPERAAVEEFFGSSAGAGHLPRWKARVPRDNNVSWDFEDVRDHYVRTLFEVEPALVRREDSDRYLDLGRAAVCEAMSAAFRYWRRPDSECAGALVLSLRDLEAGAGWGLVDNNGEPKAPWYALRRLSQPVAVTVADEGLDGLRIDIYNDRPENLVGTAQLRLFTRAGLISRTVDRDVSIAGRDHLRLDVDDLIGSFADVNYAYRFGRPEYDAVDVRLLTADGSIAASTVHLLGATNRPLQDDIGLTAALEQVDEERWLLTVCTESAAQYICVDVPGFQRQDSWFHLPASGKTTVELTSLGAQRPPSGHVRALNSRKMVAVRAV